jgi:hypothetical protein
MDTEVKALAVLPCNSSPSLVVTMVTPVANCPMMRRKLVGSMAMLTISSF